MIAKKSLMKRNSTQQNNDQRLLENELVSEKEEETAIKSEIPKEQPVTLCRSPRKKKKTQFYIIVYWSYMLKAM